MNLIVWPSYMKRVLWHILHITRYRQKKLKKYAYGNRWSKQTAGFIYLSNTNLFTYLNIFLKILYFPTYFQICLPLFTLQMWTSQPNLPLRSTFYVFLFSQTSTRYTDAHLLQCSYEWENIRHICKIIIYKKIIRERFPDTAYVAHTYYIIWLFLSAFSDSVVIYTFWGILPRLLSYLKHDPTSCKKEAFPDSVRKRGRGIATDTADFSV